MAISSLPTEKPLKYASIRVNMLFWIKTNCGSSSPLSPIFRIKFAF
ncbi:hypothetical protein BH24BAC1_BH24BAC1_00800 [soil metagenome]